MKKIISGILVLIWGVLSAGCSANSAPALSKENMASTAVVNTDVKDDPKEIYSDDLISMSFVKKYEVPEVQGMFYFDIKVDNKSDEEISVYLQDAYMNDTAFTACSGVPLDLISGKSSTHSFFGKYEGTEVKSINEIKKIGFKILVMDKSSKTLETTKSVEINF